MLKRKSIHLTVALCVVLLLGQWPGGGVTRAEPASSREYQVKAAFLYNFAQFVEWPDDAFPGGKHAPIVIGVVGDNPFGSALDQAVRGKSVDGRPIVVKYFSSVAAAEPCQILFLAASERDRVQQALEKAGGVTLTVGDFDGFTASGGIFRFLTEENKVRFEANLDAARGSRVKISAKLLKLAKIRGK